MIRCTEWEALEPEYYKHKLALKDFEKTKVDVKGFISVRHKRALEYILAENVCKLRNIARSIKVVGSD